MSENGESGTYTDRIRRDRRGRLQRSPLRETDWTEAKREVFLRELAVSSNVKRSVKAAEMSVPSIYRLRERDAAFRHAWDEALAEGYAQLELEMLRRARFGAKRTIREGPELAVKQVIHSYSDGQAFRLLTMHRNNANLQRAVEAACRGEAAPTRTTAEKLAELRTLIAEMRERDAAEQAARDA